MLLVDEVGDTDDVEVEDAWEEVDAVSLVDTVADTDEILDDVSDNVLEVDALRDAVVVDDGA